MKKLLTKKTLIATTVVSLALSVGSIAYSATTQKKITALQDYAISIEVGGKEVDLELDGSTLYPIKYEGRTYVPARIVADALGADVQWDANRQVVVITPEGQTPPVIDNSKPSTPPASTSGNKGTFADPVKFGTAFTYTDLVNYKPGEYDTSSADYTVTLKKVTPIPVSDYEDYRIDTTDLDPDVEYVRVLVDLKVKNVTMKAGSEGTGYAYLANFTPQIWGAQALNDYYVIGGWDSGFAGSMDEKIDAVLPDFPKVTPSTKGASFEVSGEWLLPVIKGQENYLVLSRQDTTLDYEDTKIFFKLK
ncbi:copper amine oxidase N-terminal domain-containing protein [Paenibacillus nanensis]|uniref:Copper amine oxidase N-terminal domain-containing protein n=1 Tax=Paenibacillus nanensis TaxID=393251 RepID=A0A3A1URU1_9BACL|nr:copper amine oxidase N-terminal domain-containing protein [Paenibacillus nanensis]RIX51279.1 copper amine oxidase N-terminal domain-containing protein [Paenibacillus nanensis]